VGPRIFHSTLWDFCNDQSFFFDSQNEGRVLLFPVAWEQHAEGGMTISALILILLLTFAAADALQRLSSTLFK